MAYAYEYKCDRCFQEDTARPIWPRWYLLADGTYLTLFAQLAWCADCRHLGAAEDIPDLRALEARLGQWQSKSPDDPEITTLVFPGYSAEQYLRARIEIAGRHIAWRHRRSSPARCLQCGATSVVFFNTRDDLSEMIPHPDCGGNFKLTAHFHASPAVEYVYDPEGTLIASPTPEDASRGFMNAFAQILRSNSGTV
jgi:hypothetical protein